jgi:hypothetical protein
VIKKKVNEHARKAAKTMWMIDYAKWNDCILWIQPWQNECQRCINNCWSYMSCDLKLIRSWLYIIKLLSAFIGKIITTRSLPHLNNGCQLSVNDSWSCVLGNHTTDMLQSVIKLFLAALIGKTDCNTLPAPSWKCASTEHQQFLVISPGKSHHQ